MRCVTTRLVYILRAMIRLQFAVDRTRNLRASENGKRQEAKDGNGSSQVKSSCTTM
jgi:hypothetical protein